MTQLEFDLDIDPITRFEIDITCMKNHIEVLRKSSFARTHAMQKDIEEMRLMIEKQNREIEALKTILLVDSL